MLRTQFRLAGATPYHLAGLILTLIVTGLFPVMAWAQVPERTEAFVYGITHYNGLTYGSAIVPPSVDTVYLIADVENVIASRRTLIYFWPLTNKYLADWNEMNELVEGTLEVYQRGQLFTTVALTDYLIQYDSDNPLGTLRLYVKAEAQVHYAEFEKLQDDYRQALFEYYQAQQTWRDQINELLKNAPPGSLSDDDLPKGPNPVPPLTIFSTVPAQGFVVSLPEGMYEVQVKRPDGSLQPDSRKKLVVFNKRRGGLAFNVVPATRWNRPEESHGANSVIYAPAGMTLYLQPFRESEYNELFYTRMGDPQDQSARQDRWVWVSHEPYQAPELQVTSGGRVLGSIPLQSYYVQQTRGGGLGYEVVLFDSAHMDQPTFEGFKLQLTSANAEYIVQFVDERGGLIPGSQRRIRALRIEQAWMLYALGSLPLVVGAGVIFARRQNVRRIKVEE